MSSIPLNPDELAAGTIKSAGSNVLSLAYGALSSGINGHISSHYARKMMRYQDKLNVKNWEMQNAYNLPSAQVQRLRAAGLNPDLIYGGGANSLASLPSSVGLGSPDTKPSANPLLLAQIENLNADTKLKEADAANKNKETSWIDKLNETQVKLLSSQIDLNDKTIASLDAQIGKINSEKSLIDTQNDIQISIAKYADEYQFNIMRKIRAEANLTEKQAQLLEKYGELFANLRLSVGAAQIYNYKATGQAALSNAESERMNAFTNRMNAYTNQRLADIQQFVAQNQAELGWFNASLNVDRFHLDTAKTLMDYDVALKNVQNQANYNKTYHMEATWKAFNSTVNTFVNAFSTFTGAGSMQGLGSAIYPYL